MATGAERSSRAAKVGCGVLLSLTLSWAGCVSQAKARAEREEAYRAGQREALLKMQQLRGPGVTISGPVRNPFVPWTPELTLAQAIIASGYEGPDPKEIIIYRDGQPTRIPTAQLLGGEDVPLDSGDVIKIVP